MKPRFHSPLFAVAATLLALPAASAATWTGDAAPDVSWATAGNWSGTAPDNVTAQPIVYDNTSDAGLAQTLNASYTTTGITLTSPTGAVTVGNGTGTGNTLTIGSGGIDMSSATQNLTLSANLLIGANQTWTVNGGRTLTGIAGSTTSIGTGTGNINIVQSGTGTATTVFNQNGNGTGWGGYSGNITVNSNVKVQSQGNAAAAFGTGTITLAGGTIAQNNGNWTWGNNIDVTAASLIGTDSSSGLGRTLKLLGNLTSTNSSGLTFTNSTTGGTRTDNNGFILAGANASTYTTTTISANSRVRVGGNDTASVASPGLNAGTRGSLGTGDVSLSATSSELAFTRTDSHTVGNKITGSGTVVIGGTTTEMAGTSTQVVTLSSAASDYTGTTTVKNGRLNLTGSLTSAITVASGAKISGTGTTSGLLTLSSGGGLALAGGATTASITANGATFSGSNVATFLAPPVASTVYDVFTYGLGTVTTPENFSVPYRGTLSNDTINKKYVFTAGEFGATRTWNTTTGNWAVNADTNFNEGDQKFFAADHVVFGNIASDSTVTLIGAIIPGSVTVNNAANAYIFTGTAISGATSLTKSGTGTLALTSANTYTGGTTLNDGVLQVGINTALGSGTLAFNGGKLSSDSATARSISNSVTVGGIVTLGDATNNGTLTLTGSVNLGNSGHKLTTISGASIDGGAVILTGSGGIEINGGTFTNNMQAGSSSTGRDGSTTLTSGNLVINTSISMFGSGVINLNGGAIGSGTTSSRTYTNNVNIGGNVAFGGTAPFSTGQLEFQGPVDLQGATRTLASNLTSLQGTKISGQISNGGIELNGASAGILTLSGTNTYTGPTTVTSGYLAVGNSAVSNSSSLSLAANTRLYLGINGITTVNNLTGAGSAAIRTDFNISGLDGARTLQINQTSNGDYAGSFSQGTGGRTISLIKGGAATLTLSGTATGYTGTTQVDEGNLAVTGSLGATTVIVANGATLSGNGNIGGSVTIEVGGTHALAVASTVAGQVTRTITGALDLSAVGDILSITAAAPPAAGTYILATATGGITGTPETVNQTGVSGTFAINGNNLELTVGGDDFASWIGGFTFDPGADLTATGDPDGDGLSNFEEYAFGLKPNNGASVNPITVQLSKTSGTFTYTRRDEDSFTTGMVYTVWTSENLVNWTEDTLATQDDTAGPNGEGVEPVVVTLSATTPLSAAKLFVRVKALKPAP